MYFSPVMKSTFNMIHYSTQTINNTTWRCSTLDVCAGTEMREYNVNSGSILLNIIERMKIRSFIVYLWFFFFENFTINVLWSVRMFNVFWQLLNKKFKQIYGHCSQWTPITLLFICFVSGICLLGYIFIFNKNNTKSLVYGRVPFSLPRRLGRLRRSFVCFLPA